MIKKDFFGFKLFYRPDTTDEKCIREVIERQGYKKAAPSSGDVWLDFGASIGVFNVWATSKGAKCISFEADPDTVKYALRNSPGKVIHGAVMSNRKAPKQISFFSSDAHWRSSLTKRRGRIERKVPAYSFAKILKDFPQANCLKMDIEGEEINILRDYPIETFKRFRKIIFEYHFDSDKIVANYDKMIRKLKLGFTVKAPSFPKIKIWNVFPSGKIVYAERKS